MCEPALKERYVNFYTDFAFKKLFGTESNKELLISFLNSLFDGKEQITDLTYLNVEHLGRSSTNRKAVFDVYCQNEQGEKFLIEMQKTEQEYFKDRSIFYSTFPIQEQSEQGPWNFRLSKVYTIAILNFVFEPGSADKMYHEVKLVDLRTKNVFYDKLTYIYLEMPKFKKGEGELETTFDKWLYAMKNLNQLMDKPQALQEAVFQRLFDQAEIARFSPSEMKSYRESQKDFWDLFSVTQTAENKGHARGLAEGKAQGLAEGKVQGLAEGMEKGLAEGKVQGLAEGMEKGLAEGKAQGLAEGKVQGLAEGKEKGLKEGMEKGMEKGMERGLKEGLEKGRVEERIRSAQLFVEQSGLPLRQIAEIMRLSAEELETLSKCVKTE